MIAFRLVQKYKLEYHHEPVECDFTGTDDSLHRNKTSTIKLPNLEYWTLIETPQWLNEIGSDFIVLNFPV